MVQHDDQPDQIKSPIHAPVMPALSLGSSSNKLQEQKKCCVFWSSKFKGKKQLSKHFFLNLLWLLNIWYKKKNNWQSWRGLTYCITTWFLFFKFQFLIRRGCHEGWLKAKNKQTLTLLTRNCNWVSTEKGSNVKDITENLKVSPVLIFQWLSL